MRIVAALLIASWTMAASAQDFAPPTGTLTVGTAFFVGAGGLAVTAGHVVEGCTRVRVASPLLQGTEAALIASDRRTDLALLQARVPFVPGVIGMAAAGRNHITDAVRVLGYGGQAQAFLQEAQPRVLTGRVRVRSADPRFRIWLQDERIAHGWSGGPVLSNGRLSGVLLELLPDPAETARVLGRPEYGVAAGTDAAAVAALLARAGIRPGAGVGPPGDAVVRVFCWR